jgi:hypothetical protein
MDRVVELVRQARRLDLDSADGRFRLGEIADELLDTGLADILDRLAIDLEVDLELVSNAWHVATAFPPPTRRPSLAWDTYTVLRYHPDRHELVDLVVRYGWTGGQLAEELAARFAAKQDTGIAADVSSG